MAVLSSGISSIGMLLLKIIVLCGCQGNTVLLLLLRCN